MPDAAARLRALVTRLAILRSSPPPAASANPRRGGRLGLSKATATTRWQWRARPTRSAGDHHTDDDTGSTWDALGRALQGRQRGTSLRRVLTVEVIWLAWYAFFPQAEVLG